MTGATRLPASVRCGLSLAGLAGVALACISHSPFSRSPSEIAALAPCTYMGTVHKESRARIEELRACGAVTLEEWKCMAQALKELDDRFTAECRTRSVAYREIGDEQRARFTACFAPERPDIVDCTPLDAAEGCIDALCGEAAPPTARPVDGDSGATRDERASPASAGSPGSRALHRPRPRRAKSVLASATSEATQSGSGSRPSSR